MVTGAQCANCASKGIIALVDSTLWIAPFIRLVRQAHLLLVSVRAFLDTLVRTGSVQRAQQGHTAQGVTAFSIARTEPPRTRGPASVLAKQGSAEVMPLPARTARVTSTVQAMGKRLPALQILTVGKAQRRRESAPARRGSQAQEAPIVLRAQ